MKTPPPTALILAAGESSRFWPLSTHGHKSLHRLGGRPLIEHTVRSLVAVGLNQIIVVQSAGVPGSPFPYRTIEQHLGDGRALGAEISYVVQPDPRGQRDAILRGTTGIEGEFVIVNPENLNAGEIVQELLAVKGDVAAVVAAHERDDTWQFGVFEVTDGQLTGFVEKPKRGTEPSRMCNMSVQVVGPRYLELLKEESDQDPVANLTALLKLANESNVRVCATTQPFFPLKYPWDLFPMAAYLKPPDRPYFGENVHIDPSATVDQDSVIEQDSVIGPGVRIIGSLIGAGSRIGATVSSSILGADVVIETGAVLRDHSDAATVTATIKGQSVDSGRPLLGAVIGQGSMVGGVQLGAGCLIGAGARVSCDIAPAASLPDQTET